MSTDLRAKFRALRTFVEGIPAEKLDMGPVYGECCCVIGHAKLAGIEDHIGEDAFHEHLHTREIWNLFNHSRAFTPYQYPTGQPAKDEFLRRLDALELKYCGAVS